MVGDSAYPWHGARRPGGSVTDVVAAFVGRLGDSLIDVRDRAILLVGFAGAMRRSELSALDVADVVVVGVAEGLKVSVARSKLNRPGGGGSHDRQRLRLDARNLSRAGMASVAGAFGHR